MHIYTEGSKSKMVTTKFCIARDEGCITVVPDHPEVRKFLTLERRDMVKEKQYA